MSQAGPIARSGSSGLTDSGLFQRRAADLIRRTGITTCKPDISVREAAELMVAEGVDSVLVQGRGNPLGIFTDRDLRAKVAALGKSLDTPIVEVMSAPVITVGAERRGTDVLLTMLENDVHHVPVVDRGSKILGVIADVDLLWADAQTPFALRRAVAEAKNKSELRVGAERLLSTVVSLHRVGLPPKEISQVIAVVADALIRRMIELAIESEGPPPTDFVWLALGSHGRREAVPSSDVDSGMAWRDASDPHDYMHAIAEDVADCLDAIGWRLDPRGVTASGEFSARPLSGWRRAAKQWLANPADEKVLIATSILLDGRVVYGPKRDLDPRLALFEDDDHSAMSRRLLQGALAHKPPTGRLSGIGVENSGEHRGMLEIKHGGVLPVVNIARYAGFKAGANAASTVERLRAASEAGALEPAQSRVLEEAFSLFSRLRLDHQVRQLERGAKPDNYVDPKRLNALTRRYLRDAFREVASVQKALARELMWSV